MGKALVSALLIIGVLAACSDSSDADYLDVDREVRTEFSDALESLGSGPNVKLSDSDARQTVEARIQELSVAGAEINALLFRWRAVSAPEKFQLYHDLVVEMIQASLEAIKLAQEAFEAFGRQIGSLFPDPDEGNVLLQRARDAGAESNAFGTAADRELARIRRVQGD